MTQPLFVTTIPSPLGPLRLVASELAWVGAYLPAQRGVPATDAREAPAAARAVLARAAAECRAYFRRGVPRPSTPLELRGTPFQRAVWTALREIPYGERRSYGWLASRIGRPNAVRAVGAAVGRNPLSIVVPCHRVIGADGAMRGYAGGLGAKRWLLAHERAKRQVRVGLSACAST